MLSLAQTAYEQIRQRIVAGELTAETVLSETSLALDLQISRTPVREAIRRLECEGLLEQRAKLGTYVRVPDRREMRELFELRILLEPPAAARAARRRQAGLVRRLAEVLDEMKQVVHRLESESDPQKRLDLWSRRKSADRAFHEAIVREGGNQRVCKVLDDAGILSLALRFPRDCPSIRLEHNRLLCSQAFCEHAEILDAIRKGEPRRAFRSMRRHLIEGRRKATDYIDWLERQSDSSGATRERGESESIAVTRVRPEDAANRHAL